MRVLLYHTSTQSTLLIAEIVVIHSFSSHEFSAGNQYLCGPSSQISGRKPNIYILKSFNYDLWMSVAIQWSLLESNKIIWRLNQMFQFSTGGTHCAVLRSWCEKPYTHKNSPVCSETVIICFTCQNIKVLSYMEQFHNHEEQLYLGYAE